MFIRHTQFFGLLLLAGCARPTAEPLVVTVPVPVMLGTAPAEPPVPPLAALAPLSLGVPAGSLAPPRVALPNDAGGKLVADLLRPTAPPRPLPPVPEPPPPETWADRGHLPLPPVPPPAVADRLPPRDPGGPTVAPVGVPADLGDRYRPDLGALTVPDRWPPAGLGGWLLGLAGGPLPGLSATAGAGPIGR